MTDARMRAMGARRVRAHTIPAYLACRDPRQESADTNTPRSRDAGSRTQTGIHEETAGGQPVTDGMAASSSNQRPQAATTDESEELMSTQAMLRGINIAHAAADDDPVWRAAVAQTSTEQALGHRLTITGSLLWCVKCVAFAHQRHGAAFKRECTGYSNLGARRARRDRLARGLHPVTAKPL